MSGKLLTTLRYDVTDRTATITLDRPAARNALSTAMRSELPATMARADDDRDVDVVILTGADPAFCAGLDLAELASGDHAVAATALSSEQPPSPRRPFEPISKPVIAAVNGPAVTGGFELALHCDFIVASERARFADTHSRVGIQPGWGLTAMLSAAVGVRRARELSGTGNFLDAATAHAWGLVNHVVPHEELLPFCRRLGADICSNDQAAVHHVLGTYRLQSSAANEAALEIESRRGW
ncbi:MAG: enoyl-CoA hydratase, partial [Microbacteriaceae bacterium]